MSFKEEEDYLQISGLQHYAFCPRQWALIHIEKQWAENALTAEGIVMHEKVHDVNFAEQRGGLLTTRGLRVVSHSLGVTGMCDAVEFTKVENGATLHGRSGQWLPYPIEYKRGKKKDHNADELQLCCQAMCLEEMMSCEVLEGALFYFGERHRSPVVFTEDLRSDVRGTVSQMRELYHRGYTPRPKQKTACKRCSLVDICLPALMRQETHRAYFDRMMKEADTL